MAQPNHHLLVVLIAEGRNFPRRANRQLILESRFDGELLATDPVSHVETPSFNSELAWEVSKKLLHQYKLQRTPIKLHCYASEPRSGQKEAIGYILLDLRSAAKCEDMPALMPVRKKWYPLLGSRYPGTKPELQIGLSLEVDMGPKDGNSNSKAAPPRKGKAPTPSEGSNSLNSRALAPVLNHAEGFFQIGPAERCKERFILSVTIASAQNLTELVPTTIPLPHREAGFFFFYQLFGNDVTNEAFKDLLNPNFACERASVHLQSSVDVLRAYFRKEPCLQVHLCCGEQILGSTTISLDQLLHPPSDVIDREPVTVEGAFPLTAPAKPNEKQRGASAPTVVASVILRREEVTVKGEQVPSQPQADPPGDRPKQRPSSEGQGRPPPDREGDNQEAGNQKRAREQYSDEDTDREIDSLVEEEDHIPERDTAGKDKGRKPPASGQQTRPVGAGIPGTTNIGGGSSMAQEQRPADHQEQPAPSGGPPLGIAHWEEGVMDHQQPPLPPAPGPGQQALRLQQHHQPAGPVSHFIFSIDLRSVKNVNTSTALNIYLRYTYPFFGSAAPILTHPPVEIMNKHMEAYLPNSFCSFEFASYRHLLQDTINRVPLSLEVWHRDKETKDLLLGVAEVPLGSVLSSARVPVTNSNLPGNQGWRQISSVKAVAHRGSENPTTVAEILVALGLEDFGPISTQEEFLSSRDPSQVPQGPTATKQEENRPPPAPPDPRETVEYKTALQLEMWKEQQADLFENQMKEKEEQRLRSLAEEFKRRDKEREMLLKKKLDEYGSLEEQLRFALTDVEKRERQLIGREEEASRLSEGLQRDYDRNLTEVQEASRRMKEDCLHQIELEKSKTNHLEGEIERLKEQVREQQQLLQQKDRDFESYKEHNSTKPETKLQSEISLLNLEKVELERKLESVTKSKIHYKQQWGRALKELARLKERQQVDAKARLQKQQQELEHMRLRYLAAEEKDLAKTENLQLEDIKGELQKLQEQELAKKAQEQQRQQQQKQQNQPVRSQPPPEHSPRRGGGGGGRDMRPAEDSADEQVARLIEERDTLLRTGVYNHQDKIIVELDRQIREAINQGAS